MLVRASCLADLNLSSQRAEVRRLQLFSSCDRVVKVSEAPAVNGSAIDDYAYLPQCARFIPNHTGHARGIVHASLQILQILGMRHYAQIAAPIVERVTIDVVALYLVSYEAEQCPVHRQQIKLAIPTDATDRIPARGSAPIVLGGPIRIGRIDQSNGAFRQGDVCYVANNNDAPLDAFGPGRHAAPSSSAPGAAILGNTNAT
jgi:hypothetical protein